MAAGKPNPFKVLSSDDPPADEVEDVVDLGSDSESDEDADVIYDDDDENLALVFAETEKGLKALKAISSQVVDDFDDDWESSEEYRERAKADWLIFAGELPKKKFPYESSANAHLPLMLENITRVTSRAYSELFGDWTKVMNVTGVGGDDDAVADLLSRHGNWQLAHQLPDFKRQQARGVLVFFAQGDVTNHSYYDTVNRRNAHEILTPDEFVTPFSHVTTMPDYSDLPRVTKVMHRYRHELEAMDGIWLDVDKILAGEPPCWDDEPSSDYARGIAEAQGIQVSESKRSNAYRLLLQEGWFDLPGQDRQRFCQVIVEYSTKAVLSLTIHEEDDWQDRERYDRQSAEGEQYAATNQAFMAAKAQHDAMSQAHAEIGSEIHGMAVDPRHAQDLMAAHAPLGPAPTPPVQPDWMLDGVPDEEGNVLPEPVRRVPLHMFAHGVCIEPLIGNLGLSFGRQQADHNRAVDTWLSQYTDAATLSNCWSLILAGGAEFEDDFSIAPGKTNHLKNVPAGDIDKYIKELRPAPANPQFMEMIGLVWDKAQSSIQSSPVLSGEAGKSGETFRGMNSRIEQAVKQLSVPTRWYADFFSVIARNNAKLNAAYLRDEEIFMVNNDRAGTPGMEELRIGRKMYERNYQITMASDLSFATDAQRIAQADECMQMPTAMPPLQGNQLYLYLATKASLTARNRYDLVEALGPKPPANTIPFGTPPPPPPGVVPGARPGAPGGQGAAPDQQ